MPTASSSSNVLPSRPRYAVGAAPAEIAPPISLRRDKSLLSTQPSRVGPWIPPTRAVHRSIPGRKPWEPQTQQHRAMPPSLAERMDRKSANLTSWVLVDNRAVELHKITEKDAGKMTCFIETPSTPSSEFAVGFRDDRPASSSAPDLLIECVVDGVPLKGDDQCIRAWKDPRKRVLPATRTWTWKGRRESLTVVRPFVFSPLRLTDDEDLACSSETILRNLGTIQVRVYRGKVLDEAASTAGEFAGTAVGQLRFEESSAKVKGGGVSHQTGLGSPREMHQPVRSTFKMSSLDSASRPYAVFEFVYRSRDVLEAQGIVEPSPERKNGNGTGRQNLGVIVLDSDDDDDYGLDARHGDKVITLDDASPYKKPMLNLNVRDETDEDAEIRRLRAEIAELRKQAALVELRKERDELARVAAEARRGGFGGSRA
ncbi:hypothetical protein JCM10212_006918 [Sporobolomyces blumeae]